MEEKLALALLAATWVAVVLRTVQRGGGVLGGRSRAKGMLIFAASSLSLVCLRRGRISCRNCRIRPLCWRPWAVPAVEEIAGQLDGVVGKQELVSALRDGLERIRRFLRALTWLLDRLIELLTLLPIRELSRAIKELRCISRLVATLVPRRAQP